MKASIPRPANFLGLDPLLFGTLCSVVSSIGYSCSNICLRALASCDPLLVSCVKAVPTMLVAIVLVAGGILTRRMRWPSRRAFGALALAGTVAQLAGNGFFQWSLGQVGLALTVPICAGSMIIAATVLGRVWLGEPVTPRSALALGLLITAIGLLSLGAEAAPLRAEIATATPSDSPRAHVGLVLLAVGVSGIAYAVLNVLIRRLMTGSSMSMPFVMATVSSVGVVSLGLASIWRLGWPTIDETALADLGIMFVAGAFNAVGFFTLAKALQLVPIVQVNAVSASQSAFAALAGVALFGEAITVSLTLGVALTIIGLGLVDRGRKDRAHPAHPEPTAPDQPPDVPCAPTVQVTGAAPLPRAPTIK